MHARFLPVTMEEVRARGWDAPDFVYVTGDAYVDHPSFGLAIISRVLEKAGYRVAMLPQPRWHDCSDFKRFGRPKIGFLVTAGVIDSMVNHYTAAKKPRSEDAYSPGGQAGRRPDRATVVYANRIREAYGPIPIGIGGVEASLRRFAHYDYWDDRVRNSVLVDAGADILMFGMGERMILKVAERMARGGDFSDMRIPGTCVMGREIPEGFLEIESSATVAKDKFAYARAFKVQYDQQDPVRGKPIAQLHGRRYLLQNKPDMPLSRAELDATYALPYARAWHPMYDEDGGIPALEEVKFSIASARGCFGGCSFCALTFHQGRIVTSRSKESIVEEGKLLAGDKDFKGYIHDVGGPTANFRAPACKGQLEHGACVSKQCLFPKPCANLVADHSEYVDILRTLRAIQGVKKVFVRSGVRFDYVLEDKKSGFLRELVRHHVSGQLKVAPEHVSPRVLQYMGKPEVKVYDRFIANYERENEEAGMKQFLVPYFMSSHPGCTLEDAVYLAEYMRRTGQHPDQVQDFYPTPGTLSTAMYFTGLDPRDMTPVYVPRDPEEKAMQRALMQYNRPQNRLLVERALALAGRRDLIGFGKNCLIPPRDARAKGTPGSDLPRGARKSASGVARTNAMPGMESPRGARKKADARMKATPGTESPRDARKPSKDARAKATPGAESLRGARRPAKGDVLTKAIPDTESPRDARRPAKGDVFTKATPGAATPRGARKPAKNALAKATPGTESLCGARRPAKGDMFTKPIPGAATPRGARKPASADPRATSTPGAKPPRASERPGEQSPRKAYKPTKQEPRRDGHDNHDPSRRKPDARGSGGGGKGDRGTGPRGRRH